MDTLPVTQVTPQSVPMLQRDPHDILADYIRNVVACGVASKHTERVYRDGLDCYLGWCREVGLDPAQAQVQHLEAYRTHLIGKGYKRATIWAKIAGLRAYFASLQRAGVRSDNPAAMLRPPKPSETAPGRTIRKSLSRGEALRLLTVLDPLPARESAPVYLMLLRGLRVGEVCALQLADWDASNGLLSIPGKGSKRRTLAIEDGRTRKALDAWIVERGAEPGSLFRTYMRRMQWDVEDYLKAAGIQKPGRNCHALRHTFAMVAKLNGTPSEALADALGHSNLATTDIYSRAAAAYQDNPGETVERAFQDPA